MPELTTIYDYMRANAPLLGERILQEYPALHRSTMQSRLGLKGYCERLFLHRRSPSWE